PDVEETFIDMNIKAMYTNKMDIESLRIPGETRTVELPAILGNRGIISVKGFSTGFYNGFVANARVNTDLGNLVTDLTLRRQKGSRVTAYNGKLDMQSFDLGRLLEKSEIVGMVTMRANIDGKGFSLENADLSLNSQIDSIWLNHYF
ncbi:MAG: hypothetical protein WC886_09000, partial [Saccharofermentanaceae bacterium]